MTVMTKLYDKLPYNKNMLNKYTYSISLSINILKQIRQPETN